MRKIIGFLSNSKSVGMDCAEAFLFEDNTTPEEIGDVIFDAAVGHASSFYEVIEDEDCTAEDYDETSQIGLDKIESYWEEYDPKSHDSFRTGGGSFEDDFEGMLE